MQRYRFNTRHRQPGETVATYVAQLKKLGEHCNFHSLEEMVRDRLVCGIADGRIQRRLLQEPDLDYQKALDIALAMELANQDITHLQQQQHSTHHIKRVHQTPRPSHKPTRPTPSPCYRCGADNHTSDTCKFKSAECRYCKKIGHIAKVCKSLCMSLEQIKDVIDKQDFSAISPSPSLPTHKQGGIPTPFAGFTPKPNPASPRPSIDNGKPNIRKSLAVPKSDRSSRSSPGHRLSTPNKSSNKREYNYATSPSHVPRSNNHTQISPSHQHDNSDSLEEEDEEQEVYIAPADMNEPIYQNHGEEKQTPYANVEYTKPSVDNDIYQNITFDGKPVTPPRRVQPQQPPQVQPRRKK